VHIGHNCRIGRDCLLCGQVGFAGSAVLGDRVVLGGQCGVSDNIEIGSDVVAAGATKIYSNVPAGRMLMGSPGRQARHPCRDVQGAAPPAASGAHRRRVAESRFQPRPDTVRDATGSQDGEWVNGRERQRKGDRDHRRAGGAGAVDDVALDATLEDLGIDSLGLVESIFAIEEAFDIQVPFNANEPEESDFDISSVAAIVARGREAGRRAEGHVTPLHETRRHHRPGHDQRARPRRPADARGDARGRCGIGPLELRDVERLSVRIGGQVKGYDPEALFNRQQIALYDRFTQFTLIAARQAIEQGGADLRGDLAARSGVVLGTAGGGVNTWDENYRSVYEEGKNRVHPFVVPKLMNNAAASHVSMEWNLKGPSFSVATACASSNHAMGQAFQLIRGGGAT
jgi:acyl carrier protein